MKEEKNFNERANKMLKQLQSVRLQFPNAVLKLKENEGIIEILTEDNGEVVVLSTSETPFHAFQYYPIKHLDDVGSVHSVTNAKEIKNTGIIKIDFSTGNSIYLDELEYQAIMKHGIDEQDKINKYNEWIDEFNTLRKIEFKNNKKELK